jgi:hypothetical protein
MVIGMPVLALVALRHGDQPDRLDVGASGDMRQVNRIEVYIGIGQSFYDAYHFDAFVGPLGFAAAQSTEDDRDFHHRLDRRHDK